MASTHSNWVHPSYVMSKNTHQLINISEKQAKALQVNVQTQLSPYLEKCCLLVSGNVS